MPPNQPRQAPANDDDDASRNVIPPRVKVVRRLIASEAQRLTTLLPKAADVERFIRVFLDVVENGDPKLLECTDRSLRLAIVKSATVALEAGGPYPHAYVLPRWAKIPRERQKPGAPDMELEAYFEISVWGYVELVRRTGLVKKVWADVVRANDHYEPISGSAGKQIVHRPDWFATEEERGKVRGSYACALLENGETVFEPVPLRDLETARAQNRGKSPAWDLWYEQQCQKVALKRLQKYLPKHSLLDLALEIDEGISSIDTTGEPVPERGARSPEALPMPSNAGAALDAAVFGDKREKAAAAARAAGPGPAKAANSNARSEPPPGEHRLDRDRLFSMLCDVDEDTWGKERARVDGWDEVEALSVLNFVRGVLQAEDPDDIPPKPACMAVG